MSVFTRAGLSSPATAGAEPGLSARRGWPVGRAGAAVTAVCALLALALVGVRLYSPSPLWLDEALSVDTARLPVPDLLAALAHDGSPPLYYLVLHGWLFPFGTDPVAVRALSSLCSLLMLPLAFVVGRRLGGARLGWSAVLVVAASPFEIRYATEARMYALVGLLTLLSGWVLTKALERPTWPWLVALAGLTGTLALTHYWTVFLAVATEVALLVVALRSRSRGTQLGRAAARAAVAVPAGGLLFLPWLPTFLYQSAHTATPWSYAPRWFDLWETVRGWSGATDPVGWVCLGLLLVLLAQACREVRGRLLLAVGFGSLVLGLGASIWSGSGYSLRYSAAAIVPVLLAAAVGLARFRTGFPRRTVAAATVLAALAVCAFTPLLADRTQAGATAAVIEATAAPGDLVVYCPDQLGPAVAQLLPAGTAQVVYPTLAGPELIDWVDYAARNAAGEPASFAATVSSAAVGSVILVGKDGYLTYGSQCGELDAALTALRGPAVDLQDAGSPGPTGETAWVHLFRRPPVP